MKEIGVKQAPRGKKILGKDEKFIRVKSSNCDCGCMCVGDGNESVDYDAGFDAAFNDQNPACGCSCAGNTSLNQTLDMVWED